MMPTETWQNGQGVPIVLIIRDKIADQSENGQIRGNNRLEYLLDRHAGRMLPHTA
jgi:hypothetical protein